MKNIFWKKCHTLYLLYISVLVLSVSVSLSLSADMKNFIPAFYRYWPIRKLSLSGFIGIGQYEKKLISRTLSLMTHKCCNFQSFYLQFCFEKGKISLHFIKKRFCLSTNLNINCCEGKVMLTHFFIQFFWKGKILT